VPTDDFNRANGTLNTGNWTVRAGQWDITSNQADSSGSAANVADYTGTAPAGAAVEVQITLSTVSDGGPACRIVDGSNYFFLDFQTGSGSIQKVVAGGFTTIRSGLGGAANGDIAKLTISASDEMQAYKNGSTVGTAVTDSTHASGGWGFFNWAASGLYDDWSGSDVGGATDPEGLLIGGKLLGRGLLGGVLVH
jgi:hypothetical protein